jgi:hypothetical protein
MMMRSTIQRKEKAGVMNSSSSLESLRETLESFLKSGATYAALIHVNGVSMAHETSLKFTPHKHEELAVLGAALIAANQAFTRAVGGLQTREILQANDEGTIALLPINAEHWLLLMAHGVVLPAALKELYLALKPGLTPLIGDAALPQHFGLMDDIEFADLSNLRID